jgi:hypothetical protein
VLYPSELRGHIAYRLYPTNPQLKTNFACQIVALSSRWDEKGGGIGEKARAATLTDEERSESARRAVMARSAKRKEA